MIVFISVVARVIALTLSALTALMLLRMILSFFVDQEESRLYAFTAYATEPFIAPVRFLLAKFNILQDSPIDWSFSITYLIITMISFFLPVI